MILINAIQIKNDPFKNVTIPPKKEVYLFLICVHEILDIDE